MPDCPSDQNAYYHNCFGFWEKDGIRYEGEYKENQRNGWGTQKFANGTIYTGDYVKDEQNGVGSLVFPNGDKFEGCWENGVRQGVGTMTTYIPIIKGQKGAR